MHRFHTLPPSTNRTKISNSNLCSSNSNRGQISLVDDLIIMAPPSLLIGPPEVYNSEFASPTAAAATATGNAFVDLIVSEFNKTSVPEPLRGYTENHSSTFLSSGNPCLDFFFHVVPDTPPGTLIQRLHLAWNFSPLTTLKLICNLRGVRGTGKSDKEGFYAAALWLFNNHPKTLASNVGSFADFGYFKDLPEILYRLLEGPYVRKIQKQEWLQRKFSSRRRGFPMRRNKGKKKKFTKKIQHSEPAQVRVEAAMVRSREEKERARALRTKKRIAMAKKVMDRYNHDGDFRFLYDSVAAHFARCLKSDLESLKLGELKKISLAAKWCPSIDSSFDRSTLLCEGIARLIFPRESYDGIQEAHYAYRVRERLRKEVLVPLRKVLELPEVYIGANQWGSIPYNRVASVAMRFYKKKFMKHDQDRFERYLADVRSGKAKIAAGALLPHEIIASLDDGDDDEGEVAELQWKRMVDDISKAGKLSNCIAVCDVSGSMCGTPMEVCVALGLLVSEVSREPWKGKVITFSEFPQLHQIEGDDLKTKTEFMRIMDWGMNTDFQKVFDRILEVAKAGGLKAEEMVKRVIVFSDMEFDQASPNPWETDYEAIVRKFNEAGYGSGLPQIVFWNLRDSGSTPVAAGRDGVALLSGFSKNLLKLFLDNDGVIEPVMVMEEAISGKEYQQLVVVD